MSARYVFNGTKNGECVLYLESSDSEEKLEHVNGDGIEYIGQGGNGYLEFWVRCKVEIAKMLPTEKRGIHCEIFDNYFGDIVRQWTVR
jgi:hypothetical protein